jgi:hypothetical protein
MQYIENKLTLLDDQQGFIDFVCGSEFPWFYQEGTSAGYQVYAHGLMKRDPEHKPTTGIVNSTSYPWAKFIFDKFCQDNNIKVNTIFRAALNSTCSSDGTSDIHKDHEFDHKVFLLYLTDASGTTNIYDDDKNLLKQIKPEKYKAVVFDGINHNNNPCAIGERRVVMLFTFN